jgi:hypothetical protein
MSDCKYTALGPIRNGKMERPDDPVIDRLIEMLKHPDPEVCEKAHKIIQAIGEQRVNNARGMG